MGEADGMSYWHVVQARKINALATVDPNERQLHIDVKTSSKYADDLKLLQKGIFLNAGQGYELSFDASIQPKGDMFVALTDEDGNVYEKQKVKVSSRIQKYHFAFKNLQLPHDDKNAQLVFYLGDVKKSITIDNIHLR